ncbi:adenosine deaminase [Fodinicola feengrottensis]|uniref:Adenosine deaminase n=1 Tax=Fodinicola feengrottensis TaxID=435914 RepID=A0ABP4TJ98_9ACTN
MTDLKAFIAGLPKVELHVHHVGSASPRAVSALAARHEGTTAVPADPAALADYFTFSDFAHFIEVYQSVVALIRTTEDLHLLTYEVARDLAAQQVRYVELQVTPYTHFLAGIATQDLCAVIEDVRAIAAREFGVQMRWIFDIPGEYGIPSADVTLAAALGQRPDGLLGFGLGGPEIGHPRGTFQSYFDQAIAAGLHSVPHAGESTGPQTIWDALTLLRAERIGHGTHCMEDPKLVEHLAERQIPLEVSPTSNVCTRVVESYAQHPLPRMVEAGLLVTINSDDPPMFGTTLTHEYEVAADLLSLDAAGVAALAKNAVSASFADVSTKNQLTAEIDNYLSSTATNSPDPTGTSVE